MGVPKHKIAKTKSRMRRSNGYYTLKAPNLSLCPNCGEKKLPHRVCTSCGFYNGRQVISVAIKGE